jgi:hypothetical protein
MELKNDVQVLNVNLENKNEKPDFIHTIQVGKQGKPNIVCLHGYMSSNIAFSKILKYMYKDYNVYCLDLPGK